MSNKDRRDDMRDIIDTLGSLENVYIELSSEFERLIDSDSGPDWRAIADCAGRIYANQSLIQNAKDRLAYEIKHYSV